MADAIATLTMNPTLDTSCIVPRVVAERKLDASHPRWEPGGGGINVARVATVLGSRALAIYTRGGAMGAWLDALLPHFDFDTMPIPIRGETRQNFIVLESSTKCQYRFGMPGPEIAADEIEHALEALRSLAPPPPVLVLSGSLPPSVDPGFYARAARAVPRNTRVVVDTRGEPLRRTLEAGVYLIKPNVGELSELVGRSLSSDHAIEAAARDLVTAGGTEVVVTSLGAAGAVLVTADECVRVRSPTVPIRSKVGAGDSMVAGIAHRLLAGDPIVDAVRFGVATGAAAVMTEGTELARRDDVERLYAAMS